MLPQFAAVNAIAVLGVPQHAFANDHGDQTVDFIEAEDRHCLGEFMHRGGESQGGAVAALQQFGGQAGIVGDQVHDLPGVHIVLVQQPEQLRQKARGRGE